MHKPEVPADLMPAAWLCDVARPIPPSARHLVQRCQEVRRQARWDQVDTLGLEISAFDQSKADPLDKAFVAVHFGDVCWSGNLLAWAQRQYGRAREILRLAPGDEERHNEAAAAYGQGLVAYTVGNTPEALQYFDESSDLIRQAQTHWGRSTNAVRFNACSREAEYVEHLKALIDYSAGPAPRGLSVPGATPGEIQPLVLATIPANDADNVPVDTPLVVLFSKPVDEKTLNVSIELAGASWTAASLLEPGEPTVAIVPLGGRTLKYDQRYTVRVNARDKRGALFTDGRAPRVWSFKTVPTPAVGPGASSPSGSHPIVGVGPIDGATNVPLGVHPIVLFDRDIGFKADDLQIDPIPDSVKWSVHAPGRLAIIRPAPSFAKGASYRTFQVLSARDASRNPVILPARAYAWSFETERVPTSPPEIETFRPNSKMLEVDVRADMVITFSQPMNPTSLEYEISPELVHHAVEWDSDRLQAIIRHTPFEFDETYTVKIKQARDEAGLALTDSAIPITWSFTTQTDPAAPIICDTFPHHGQKDVPLTTPVYVSFSKPIMEASLKPLLGVSGSRASTPLAVVRHSPGRTTFRLSWIQLQDKGSYLIDVKSACDEAGRALDATRPTSIPNPWTFQASNKAADAGARTKETNQWLIGIAFATILVVVLLGIVLVSTLPWTVSIAYPVALVIATVLLVGLWRRSHLVFSLNDEEDALLERADGFVVLRGRAKSAGRHPTGEKLRAIMPTRALRFQSESCKVTNDYGEQIEFVIDLQYRVFDTISAFRFLRDHSDGKDTGSTVLREKKLRQVWETAICHYLTVAASDRLHDVRGSTIHRHRKDLADNVLLDLGLRACHWGIDLQDLQILEIRVKKA